MMTLWFGTALFLSFEAAEAFSTASDFGLQQRSFALERERFGQARLLQAPPASVVRIFNAEPAALTTSSSLMTPSEAAAGSSPAFLPQIVFNRGANEARAITNAQNSTPEGLPALQKAVMSPSMLAQPHPPSLQLTPTNTSTSPLNPSQISPPSASFQPPIEPPPSSPVINANFVAQAEANSSRTATFGPVSATAFIKNEAQATNLISTLTLQPKAPSPATIAVPGINQHMGIRPTPKRMIFN